MSRTCEITIPFTVEEKARVVAAAKKQGLSITDFIRGSVVVIGAKPSPEDVLLLFAVDHRTLQLVYDDLSNRPGPVNAEVLSALRVTLRSIEKTTRNLARRLHRDDQAKTRNRTA